MSALLQAEIEALQQTNATFEKIGIVRIVEDAVDETKTRHFKRPQLVTLFRKVAREAKRPFICVTTYRYYPWRYNKEARLWGRDTTQAREVSVIHIPRNKATEQLLAPFLLAGDDVKGMTVQKYQRAYQIIFMNDEDSGIPAATTMFNTWYESLTTDPDMQAVLAKATAPRKR